MATTILLVRHGETDWNREDRFQGHADPPLNELGRAQAAQLADELAGEHIDAVYTSDLRRAAETAVAVAERHGLPIETSVALREADVGELAGLTRPEIAARFPDALEASAGRGFTFARGEAFDALARRVLDELRALAGRHPDSRLLVVSHGGPIRAVLSHADGQPVEEHRARFPAARNAEVFRLRVSEAGMARID